MSDIVNSSLKIAAKGTSLMLIGTLFGSLMMFAADLFIARSVTKEELGMYSLAVAIVNIVALISCLGLHEGVTRHISFLLSRGDRTAASVDAGSSVGTGIISGTVTAALLLIFSGLIARFIFYMPAFESPLKIISLYIPFFVLAQIISGILRGHGIITPKIYCLDIGRPLLFISFVGILLSLGFPFIGIIYIYVFSMIIVSVSMGIFACRNTSLALFPIRFDKQINELLKFSVPLLISSVTGILLSWTDILMLGRYAGAEAVGLYSISMLLARLIPFPLGALEFIFMPLAGEMYAKSQLTELKKTYQILTKWIFSATLPIFLILFFFPEMTISFLFGDRFISSTVPLRILSLGFLFHAFFGANGILMVIIGMSAEIINVSLFGLFLNILLNYFLIKQMGCGIAGAATAIAVTYVALNAIVSLMIFRKSRIHPFTPQYLKPIAVSIVISLIIYAIAKSLPLYFWMLPLYFIAFVCSYVFSLFLTKSFESEDIALLEIIFGRMGLGDLLMKRIRKAS